MKKLFLLLLCISCAQVSKKTPHEKIIIAHRGAPGYLPEHSLAGVAMAHHFNVNFIEPDLVLTKDNKLVVLHDIHIDTTTNVKKLYPKRARKDGRFYAIDFTLKELKRLNLNERIDLATGKAVFPKRFPLKTTPFKIPTLEEFIELVKGLNKSRGKDIGIYPELKSPEFHKKEGRDMAKIVLEVLERYDYNRADANIYVQCFYPMTLIRLKALGAKFPMIQLIAENSWGESSIDYEKLQTKAGLMEIAPYVKGIGPYIKQLYTVENGKVVKTKLVEWAHELGLKVHAYTHRSDAIPSEFPSEKEFLDFLFTEVGIDGIFSDFGDKL